MHENIPLDNLAKAIFTINRHAKTALKPKHLYQLKKESIHRLLRENKAEKIGLHYSDHPKFSNQHSTLLVKINDYYFHIPPSKEDFKKLDHLGGLDQDFRNPRTKMSLSQAKKIVYKYIDWKADNPSLKKPEKSISTYYTPSSLGRMDWPPKKY